jgi:hypothetical protein
MKQVEMERKNSYIRGYKTKQNEMDPEKEVGHTPELYALWNLKPYICHKISRENPFNSSFFVYTDSGAFRGEQMSNWPDTQFITSNLSGYLGDRILFGQIYGYNHLDETGLGIEATFFAGNSKVMFDFYEHHFEIHDSRIKQGLFVGKEQTIMNLVAFRFYNSSVA